MRSFFLPSLVLILISSALIFPFLDYSRVFQVSEGREGVVVNEMLSSGELILPLRNGEIVPSKPILFHWIGYLGARVLHKYDEFGLRLPSAIFGIGCVVVTGLLGQFLGGVIGGGVVSGLLSGLVLLTSYGFFHLASDGRVDMVFSFFAVSAIALWISQAALVKSRSGRLSEISQIHYIWLGILCGFGFLAKGPLGLALPVLVIGSITILEFGWSALISIMRPGWILAILIPLPWYLAAAQVGKDGFIARQVFFENIARFVGSEGITEKPWYFYFVNIFDQGAPWSVVFVAYVLIVIWHYFKGSHTKLFPEDARARFGVKSALIWYFAAVLFFSISAGKRRAYLLPLLPAVSIVIALGVGPLLGLAAGGDFRARIRPSAYLCGWLLLSLIFLLALFCCSEAVMSALALRVKNPDLAQIFQLVTTTIAERPLALGAIFGIFFPLAAFCWAKGFRCKRSDYLACACFSLLALVLTVANVLLAVKGHTHSYKDFALTMREVIPESEPLHFVKKRLDESFDGFFFYYKRHVKMIPLAETPSEPGLYLARRSWIDSQDENFKGVIKERLTGGRLTDKPEEKLVLFEFGS